MPDETVFIYWDACVLLSYVNGTADRLPHLDAFLEKSGKSIQLITSAVSIVEVAFAKAEQDGKMLDDATEKKISRLWTSNSPIKLIEYYRLIGEGAKNLMRDAISQGWKLKPLDAIHLSTARSFKVAEFHTYSNDLHKYATIVGYKIGPPIAEQPKLI